ncbi:hypothetical protein REH59_06440 [Pseudomonas sp. BO3-4]|uniref:hypothetical protein n=1 Tax=Pseudomonas sp. BO3-4 TaxID=3094916 RepID=UPI002A59C64A|nr:hypothetical protein [Pseudomonas sp. BO3-4]WPO31285.1 hypothetical protein REH59_06440 [Pseudomonas sp. BO3-4]
MKPRTPVLGVLGLCWVCLSNPTRVEPPKFKASRALVLSVLGLRARARAGDLFLMLRRANKKTYARTQKPNKPNTLNTPTDKALNLLVFICVGFVLGWLIVCWVWNLEEWR